MTEKPNEPRVEILLKNRGPQGGARVGAMPSGDGSGRWFAFGALALLYIVMFVVFTDSFAPRVEWTDSAGRVLLEDRPVFWPLLLFAVIGRLRIAPPSHRIPRALRLRARPCRLDVAQQPGLGRHLRRAAGGRHRCGHYRWRRTAVSSRPDVGVESHGLESAPTAALKLRSPAQPPRLVAWRP